MASPYLNKNSINPRDNSFSSYLNLVKESLSNDPIYSCQTPRSILNINSSRRRTNDREIDIFSAERYFNGAMDCGIDHITSNNETKPSNEKEAKRTAKSRSKKSVGTSSEASINSRTGLLKQTVPKKKMDGKKFLGVFPCSCIGKDFIDTEREIRSGNGGHDDRKTIMEEKRMIMERIGIGFQEGLLTNPIEGVISREIKEDEKKNMHDNIEDNDGDEDKKSQCSSDLFEIKSLSIKSYPFFDMEGADESVVYEPSEASIEWSVITASAANFSISSDSEEKIKKNSRNNGSGLLTGCVSHHAVNVKDDFVKINHENAPIKINQSRPVRAPLMRYQMESLESNERNLSCVRAGKHAYIL